MIPYNIHEIKAPKAMGPNAKAYEMGECSILINKEPFLNFGKKLGWHLSIAHPNRYPSWEEIKSARYAFMPNEIIVAQIFPPKEEWVNIHQNCFHLWEIDEKGILL